MVYLPKGHNEPSFVIAEWVAEGCTNGDPELQAPLHLHFECDEAWYVLEGELELKLGDETLTVTAGNCAFVPHGTPHTYWNAKPDPAKYLLVMTPLTHKLIEAFHAAQDRSPQALQEIYKAHKATLLE